MYSNNVHYSHICAHLNSVLGCYLDLDGQSAHIFLGQIVPGGKQNCKVKVKGNQSKQQFHHYSKAYSDWWFDPWFRTHIVSLGEIQYPTSPVCEYCSWWAGWHLARRCHQRMDESSDVVKQYVHNRSPTTNTSI